MVTILPEEILNHILCCVCKRYLSCGPIKNTMTGGKICGRCNPPIKTILTKLYEEVAKQMLFPCINRYENCNLLLRFEDVEIHEKACKGNHTFSCFECLSGLFPNSLLYLINHYKELHPELLLQQPQFLVTIQHSPERYCYLYCDTLKNCFFKISVFVDGEALSLSASVLGTTSVLHQFKINNCLLGDSPKLCKAYTDVVEVAFDTPVQQYREQTVRCEFIYEVVDKPATTVPNQFKIGQQSSSLSGVEPILVSRRFPKLHLSHQDFPGNKHDYFVSSNRHQLLHKINKNFKINLTCACCHTYFWNVPQWENRPFGYPVKCAPFCLLGSTEDVICGKCKIIFYNDFYPNRKLVQEIATSPIFRINVYCRYECGKLCAVWELHEHENRCQLNLQQNISTITLIKEYFKMSNCETDYFINGNIVMPNLLKNLFRESNGRERNIPLKIMHILTDSNEKCTICYEFSNGQLHVYSTKDKNSKYHVKFRHSLNSFLEYTEGFQIAINFSMVTSHSSFTLYHDKFTNNLFAFTVWIDQCEPDCKVIM